MSIWSADSHLDRLLIGWLIGMGLLTVGTPVYAAYQQPAAALDVAMEVAKVVLAIVGFAAFAWVAGTAFFRIRGDSE